MIPLPKSLKRNLKRIKQQMDQTVTRAARSVLLPLVLKDDETFLERTRAAAAPAPLPATADVPPSAHSPSEKTLIVNENATITDLETLHLTVCAIFKTQNLCGIRQDVWEHLAQSPNFWIDHDVLLGAMRSYFHQRLQSGPDSEAKECAACLYDLHVHAEVTCANRVAYSSVGRAVPLAGFWPNPTHPKSPRSIFDEMPFARPHKFIDKTTPIGSAGSCFAMEIAHRLQAQGYNYVVTEYDQTPGAVHSRSCARWGIIFNTPSFRQLVEKAFGQRTTRPILWSMRDGDTYFYADPYRESVPFASVAEYEASQATHLAAAREALLQVKVFVITLGMNEVWRLKSDDTVFSRTPWRIAANLVERQVLTVEENLRELQTMLDLWRNYNPELKVIVSTSPVPLDSTFRADDVHVITANCHSKSVLRVVAEEFAARNQGVYYFPSYEVVMYCTKDAWQEDQRHVSREAVDKVMALFDRMFVMENVPSE